MKIMSYFWVGGIEKDSSGDLIRKEGEIVLSLGWWEGERIRVYYNGREKLTRAECGDLDINKSWWRY